MLAAQPWISGHHPIRHPNSGRRPLEPKNPSSISTNHVETKQRVEIISWRDSSNKENIPPSYSTPIEKECLWSESINASLAEELNAIQERLVRLRIEKDNNETMLRERGLMLDLEMKEIVDRGEVQKMLEMEVDRLYRLKEIRLACMRTSLIRSLRDKEEEKKMRLDQLKKAHTKAEERDGTEANSKN